MSFSFGRNWRKFLDELSDERVEQARESLAASFGDVSVEGASLIDVGCGSGLFSLAALQLGARRVFLFDMDAGSVACAQSLRDRFGHGDRWEIRRGSILDARWLAQIDAAPLVYSWGVLHHTGAMWDAVGRTLALVAPGGVACIALYNRPTRSQLLPKRLYRRAPSLLRSPMRGLYGARLIAGGSIRRRMSPAAFVRRYGERSRGMDFWRDVEDWLGGWPFDYTDVPAMTRFCEARGFELVRAVELGPGGNNEYLLAAR